MPIQHGYDNKNVGEPEHPFQPQARWEPLKSGGEDSLIVHEGKRYYWVFNVSQADIVRPAVQELVQERPYLLTDPKPTVQMTTEELLANGILGLCVGQRRSQQPQREVEG